MFLALPKPGVPLVTTAGEERHLTDPVPPSLPPPPPPLTLGIEEDTLVVALPAQGGRKRVRPLASGLDAPDAPPGSLPPRPPPPMPTASPPPAAGCNTDPAVGGGSSSQPSGKYPSVSLPGVSLRRPHRPPVVTCPRPEDTPPSILKRCLSSILEATSPFEGGGNRHRPGGFKTQGKHK